MNIAKNNNKQQIMTLLKAYGARILEDQRKQQSKMKEKRQVKQVTKLISKPT